MTKDIDYIFRNLLKAIQDATTLPVHLNTIARSQQEDSSYDNFAEVELVSIDNVGSASDRTYILSLKIAVFTKKLFDFRTVGASQDAFNAYLEASKIIVSLSNKTCEAVYNYGDGGTNIIGRWWTAEVSSSSIYDKNYHGKLIDITVYANMQV